MSQTSVTLRRALRSLREPGVAYLVLRNWMKMLGDGRFKPLYGSIFETIITPGSNPYIRRLQENSEDGLVRSDILDFEMYLDPRDEGLSRTLLQFGIREALSTRAFRQELQRLKQEVDGEVTVLEIGANIGYFALLEATVLGDRGRIYAIEPVPDNMDVLERNVRLNGYSDTISLHQVAIGAHNKLAELYVAEESNWHSFHPIDDHNDSLEVEMQTVDRFLSDHGQRPDSINVIRTDVEGFEVELFEELEPIVDAEGPLVVFVELHPSFRDADGLNRIMDQLDRCGFEVVSTVLDVYGNRFDQGWAGERIGYGSFEQLKQHHRRSNAAVELIARRE